MCVETQAMSALMKILNPGFVEKTQQIVSFHFVLLWPVPSGKALQAGPLLLKRVRNRATVGQKRVEGRFELNGILRRPH